jgi:RND family efflux transporter MFP subunit
MNVQWIRAGRLVAVASAAAALFVVSAALAQSPAPITAIPTAIVQSAAAGSGFEIDGSLQPLRQSTVAAQVGGNVLELAVKAGDRVKAGQLLARIDDRDAQAGLARTEAGVAQADAEHRNARLQAERTRELRGQGFVSQAALDVADTQLKAATAGLAQAQAGRTQAALARGYAAVVAPFDAVVQATLVEAGDLATAGRPLVALYAPGQLRAVVQVPASRSALARAASSVLVQLPDGRWVAPVARADLPTADPVSQTVEWRLDLSPALSSEISAGLLPGQNVRVRFAGAPASADAASRLTVPASAVLRRGELTAVYVAQGNGFVLKAVRLGADRGAGGIEVLAGLKAGERVALDPVRAGLAGAAAF